MVSITKWVMLGIALIGFGLFTKEASATSLTGTLARTGLAGTHIGGALTSVGTGTGDLFRGLLTPLWEVGNFVKSWTGSSPTTERQQLTGQGGGFTDAETQGGGDTGVNTEPVNTPNWFQQSGDTPVTITGQSQGSTWSFLNNPTTIPTATAETESGGGSNDNTGHGGGISQGGYTSGAISAHKATGGFGAAN
jgi:hypothetical protein